MFKVRALLLILLLVSPIFLFIPIEPAEATVTTSSIVGGTTQYKEHNYQNSSTATLTTFTQSNGTFGGWAGRLTMKSGDFLPPLLLSQNFVMITFQKNLLSGAHFNTRINYSLWYGNAGGVNSEFSVVIWDGAAKRNGAFFPNASALVKPSIADQPMQTLINSSAAGFVNGSTVLNISGAGGVGKYLTIVFFVADYDLGFGAELWVLDLKLINTSDSTVMYHNDFQCDLVSEVGGTFNDYGYCGVDSGDPPLIGNFTSLDGYQVTNLEPCGNWAYAEKKYYNFQLTIGSSNVTDTVWMQFNDGLTNITFRYDHISRIPDHVSGSNVTTMGTVTAIDNSTSGGFLLTFPILFKKTVLDKLNVVVTARANDTVGFDTGWVNQTDIFSIYNLGGLVQTVSTGTAGRISGGDTFELQAANLTSSFANQTFRKIQQFRTQFSLRLSDEAAGTGFVIGFQDLAHNGGSELYMDKGDWQVEIAMNYCDAAADVMVKGYYVIFMMEEGDLGVSDLWTTINATWYDRDDTIIKSDLFTAWPETELSIVRLWVDMWFNKINASSIAGGRMNAYYTGMDTSSFLIWNGGWSPMITNGTDSMAFIKLKNNASEFITSPQLDLMSVSFNISRPANSIGTDGRNITATLQDFMQLDYKFALGQMKGIDTPVPVETKVPDMPVSGFFAPLIAAVLGIGGMVAAGIGNLATMAWDAIDSQFPFLTDGIVSIYALTISFGAFLSVIADSLSKLLGFFAGQLGFFTVFTGMITDTFALILTFVDPFISNADSWISLFLIIFVVLPFAQKAHEGDLGGMESDIRKLGGILQTMLDWSMRLINTVITLITGLLPF